MAAAEMNGGMAQLKNIINGVAVMAICGIAATLVTTTTTANKNADEIERREGIIDDVPKMKTDIEVIKTKQGQMSKEVGEIKNDTKEILRTLRNQRNED